jgi:hypothetical protein
VGPKFKPKGRDNSNSRGQISHSLVFGTGSFTHSFIHEWFLWGDWVLNAQTLALSLSIRSLHTVGGGRRELIILLFVLSDVDNPCRKYSGSTEERHST